MVQCKTPTFIIFFLDVKLFKKFLLEMYQPRIIPQTELTFARSVFSLQDGQDIAEFIRNNDPYQTSFVLECDPWGLSFRNFSVIIDAFALNFNVSKFAVTSACVCSAGVTAFSSVLLKHRSLNNLELGVTELDTMGVITLAYALLINTSLKKVKLTGTFVANRDDLQSFVTAAKKNTRIIMWDLSKTNIDGDIRKEIERCGEMNRTRILSVFSAAPPESSLAIWGDEVIFEFGQHLKCAYDRLGSK